MAQFTGFTCDDCGEIVATSERVKKITRFEADEVAHTGEEKLDLCPECAKTHMGDLEIQPLRRRGKGKEETSGAPEGAQDDADGALKTTPEPTFSGAPRALPG